MNAITSTEVCGQSVLNALREKMRFVLESSIYDADEARISVLSSEYKDHQFIKGIFNIRVDPNTHALVFRGTVCEDKTEVVVYK